MKTKTPTHTSFTAFEAQWKKTTMAKLPDATELLKSSPRVG
jgi:hypothetical protein